MTSTVLIGNADRAALKWPQRCPRCDATDFLVSLELRVLRHKRRRRANESAVGYFFGANAWPEGLRIAVPMCPRHARANQLGGALLRDDAASAFLRDSIYLCFALSVLYVMGLSHEGADVVGTLRDLPPVALGIGAWGVLGAAALPWAHRVAWVRPIRLDRQFQTATLKFRDDAYAEDFKRLNLAATTGAPITRPPAWMRPSWRGVLASGLAGAFLLPIALVLLGVLFNPPQAPSKPHRQASPPHAGASQPA